MSIIRKSGSPNQLAPSLQNLTRTKVVATVGPASQDVELLTELIQSGVDLFRLNMAHGDETSNGVYIQKIRVAEQRTGLPVAILVDLAGPKIRLGQLHTDPFHFERGSQAEFVRGHESRHERQLTCTYSRLLDEVATGDQIVLSDGLVRLAVVSNDGERVQCEVLDGGVLRSRQGVNLPGVNLSVPALGPADRKHAVWAIRNQIDYLSLSFVRNADEIEDLKALIREHQGTCHVIAKIEKREAFDNLDAIVRSADGIMVARGDLGVEIRIEKTPVAQKQIIQTCQEFGKPVIVATQMLESMHQNRQPTRAEANDVANAILDGADACMLSGETAIGEYPVDAAVMMQRIMRETETLVEGMPSQVVGNEVMSRYGVTEAIVYGAAQVAKRVKAKLVVIATATGEAALVKAKQRDFIPTIALTDSPVALRRMNLYWGITPWFCDNLMQDLSIADLVNEWSKSEEFLTSGDLVVFVLDNQHWAGVNESIVVARID